MSYRARGLFLLVSSLGALSCQNNVKPAPKQVTQTTSPAAQTPLVKYASKYGPEAVIWADEKGMYLSDLEGQLKEKISDKGSSWCAMDHRTGLLWFERESGIYAWDLESLEPPKPAVSFGEDQERVPLIINHIDGKRWMQPRHHQYRLGLELDLSAQPPRAKVSVGCSGDMSWFCYDDNDDEAAQTFSDDIAQLNAELETLSLQNATWFVERAARAKSRMQYKVPPALAAPPAKVLIDDAACEEEPEDCGKVLALSGTPYWAVVTSNIRGDFYYETWQLYNPMTKHFFEPGTQGQAKPLPEASVNMSQLSPSGHAYITSGSLISFTRGPVLEDVALCGFVTPGLEPPEPLR